MITEFTSLYSKVTQKQPSIFDLFEHFKKLYMYVYVVVSSK